MPSPFDRINIKSDDASSTLQNRRSRSKEPRKSRSARKLSSRSPSKERKNDRTRSLSKPRKKVTDSKTDDNILFSSTQRRAPKSSRALLSGTKDDDDANPLVSGRNHRKAQSSRALLSSADHHQVKKCQSRSPKRSRSRSKERKVKSLRNLKLDDPLTGNSSSHRKSSKSSRNVMQDIQEESHLVDGRPRSRSRDRKVKSSRNLTANSKSLPTTPKALPINTAQKESSTAPVRRPRSRSKEERRSSSKETTRNILIENETTDKVQPSTNISKNRESKEASDRMLATYQSREESPIQSQSKERGRAKSKRVKEEEVPTPSSDRNGSRARYSCGKSRSPAPPPPSTSSRSSCRRPPLPSSDRTRSRSESRRRKSRPVNEENFNEMDIDNLRQGRTRSRSRSRDGRRRPSLSPETTKATAKSVSPKLLSKKELEESSPPRQIKKDRAIRRATSWSGLKKRLQNKEQDDNDDDDDDDAMSNTAQAPNSRGMPAVSKTEHGALETRRRARRNMTGGSNQGNGLSSKSDHGAGFRSRRRKETAENPFSQPVHMMVDDRANNQNERLSSKSDHEPRSRSQRRMKGSYSPIFQPTPEIASSRRCLKGEKQGKIQERGQTATCTSNIAKESSGALETELVTSSVVGPMVTTQPRRRMHMASQRNDMLKNMKSDYEAAQEQKEQEDRIQLLRQQLNDAKEKWISIKVQGDSDIEACRRSLQEQKEKLLQSHVETLNDLGVATSVSQELLQNENELLQAEHDELKTSLGEAQKENVEYRAVQQQVQTSFDSLSAFVMKKTKDRKKLEATIEKLAMIQRGAMSLKIEAGIKNIYRRNVYRCLEAIQSADLYNHILYTDVAKQIRDCEKEVGGDFLDEDGQSVLKSAGNRVIENEAPISFVEHGIVDDDCTSITMDSVTDYGDGEANDEDGDLDVAKFTQDAEKQSAAFSKLSDILHETQISSLYENRDMLVTIFKFLDKDGGGTIDREEFRMGVDLLNRRLPVTAQFQDANVLFGALDVDQSGEIDLDEFEAFFSQSANIADQMYGEW